MPLLIVFLLFQHDKERYMPPSCYVIPLSTGHAPYCVFASFLMCWGGVCPFSLHFCCFSMIRRDIWLLLCCFSFDMVGRSIPPLCCVFVSFSICQGGVYSFSLCFCYFNVMKRAIPFSLCCSHFNTARRGMPPPHCVIPISTQQGGM